MRLYADRSSPFLFFDFSYRGKRYRGSTGETSKRAAMRAAEEFRDRIAKGDPSARRHVHAPTLQEFTKEFLEWVQNTDTLDANSKRYYVYGCRLLGFSALACVPIDQLDRKLIETSKFNRPVLDRKTGNKTGEWVSCSRAYAQQAQRTLRVLLGKAAEWSAIPARISFSIGKTPGRDRLITPEMEQTILNELAKQRDRRAWMVFLTMMDTGTRPSEVFRMRLEHIDWAGRRIFIAEGKTEQARRWVGMTERMHKELSCWCFGSEGPGWLFPGRRRTTRGGHLTTIAKAFRAACKRAGIDRTVVAYLARHTFGTVALRETGNTFAVMKAMGHASLESMRPYQHQSTDQLTEVMNRRNDASYRSPPPNFLC